MKESQRCMLSLVAVLLLQSGDAFGPPLRLAPAKLANPPASVQGLRMGGDGGDRRQAESQTGSNSAWLRRKALTGAALLSVSVSSPQALRAFEHDAGAAGGAKSELPVVGGGDKAHMLLVAKGVETAPKPGNPDVERIKGEMKVFLEQTAENTKDVATKTAQGAAELTRKTADRAAQLADKAVPVAVDLATKGAEGAWQLARKTADGTVKLADGAGTGLANSDDATKGLLGTAAMSAAIATTIVVRTKQRRDSDRDEDPKESASSVRAPDAKLPSPDTPKGGVASTVLEVITANKKQEMSVASDRGAGSKVGGKVGARPPQEVQSATVVREVGAVAAKASSLPAAKVESKARAPAGKDTSKSAVTEGSVEAKEGQDRMVADEREGEASRAAASPALAGARTPTQQKATPVDSNEQARQAAMAAANLVFTFGAKAAQMGFSAASEAVKIAGDQIKQWQAEEVLKQRNLGASVPAGDKVMDYEALLDQLAQRSSETMERRMLSEPKRAAEVVEAAEAASEEVGGGAEGLGETGKDGQGAAAKEGDEVDEKEEGVKAAQWVEGGADLVELQERVQELEKMIDPNLLAGQEGTLTIRPEATQDARQRPDQIPPPPPPPRAKATSEAAGSTATDQTPPPPPPRPTAETPPAPPPRASTNSAAPAAVGQRNSAAPAAVGQRPGAAMTGMAPPGLDLPGALSSFEDAVTQGTKTLGRGMSTLKDMTDVLVRRDNQGEEMDRFMFPSQSLAAPIAASASKAGRKSSRTKVNQDAVLVTSLPSSAIDLYAVFDGHGPDGEKVSGWLEKQLEKVLDGRIGSEQAGLPEVMRTAFEDLDQQMSAELGASLCDISGATATAVLHKGGALLVAGIGDTRCILGGPTMGDKKQVMTCKHQPFEPKEEERIRRMGGEVKVFPDEPPMEETGQGRVFARGEWAPGLAVARAFGDMGAKDVGVIVTPDMRTASTGGQERVLIVASDGVWDVIDDETALALCLTFAERKDAQAAASTLVDTAREVWESVVQDSGIAIDDISAIVVFLP